MPDIVIVNASPVLTDAQASAPLKAIQTFDDAFLRPHYGFERAHYHFLPRGQLPDPRDASVWPIFLNNHSTDPGVLGWHDFQAGQVFGRCFVGDCIRDGISWTVDLTHEAWEMRGDPTIDQTYAMEDGRLAAYELCDAVESDLYALGHDGVLISDFVLPDYWSNKTIGRFDFGRHLNGPVPALTSGGYMSIMQNGAWTQVMERTAHGAFSARAMHPNGRSQRRAMTGGGAFVRGFDADQDCSRVGALAVQRGCAFVCRYLKNMSVAEAHALSRAGLKIVTIWETTAERALGGPAAGTADGKAAQTHALQNGQPRGSAIYATADFDVTPTQESSVYGYFSAFRAALGRDYKLGVYASGAICVGARGHAIADYTWLSGSMGYRGSRAFRASGLATMVQDVGDRRGFNLGISIDSDIAYKADYGAWKFAA